MSALIPGGEKKLKICLFVLTECTNVTDTRTDSRTDTAWRHRPRLHSIARQKLLRDKLSPFILHSIEGATSRWSHRGRTINTRTTTELRVCYDFFYDFRVNSLYLFSYRTRTSSFVPRVRVSVPSCRCNHSMTRGLKRMRQETWLSLTGRAQQHITILPSGRIQE